MFNTNNSCPRGYSIDELDCDKCIECSLFPCSYFDDGVDVLEDDRTYDISYDYDDYDDLDEIAWENEQRELHYGGQSEFRDH